MIDSTGAELSVELFGPEAPEVLDAEGPQVKHIVSGESVSLLQQHHFGSQESELDGRAQAARPRADDQTLGTRRGHVMRTSTKHLQEGEGTA